MNDVENVSHGKDVNSFDAVVLMKRKLDIKDPFLIYQISNGAMNNSSDYVFKSLKKTAEVALLMDIDVQPPNTWQTMNAYFDATYTHVYGFKTLALWTYHPAMSKVVWLASMEIRTENTQDITTFFCLFNEILTKVSGQEGYKFNPRCFVCDEAGANYNAIHDIYGKNFVMLECRDVSSTSNSMFEKWQTMLGWK